jgi:hypothetical protein
MIRLLHSKDQIRNEVSNSKDDKGKRKVGLNKLSERNATISKRSVRLKLKKRGKLIMTKELPKVIRRN